MKHKKILRLFLITTVITLISDRIGTITINIGIGELSLFPLLYATLIGGVLGPDLIKLVSEDESKLSGTLIIVALAPFMAKMGVGAGANLKKLINVGPALLLQEFGNLGTILISMPVAVALGLGRESIGACYSINRDSNLGLTTDIYGPEAPETRGTFAVYIVGSVIGTLFFSLLVNLVAGLNIFNPLALGMATGVGSGSMMTAGVTVLSSIYPAHAEDIAILGGASDMLTGITGIYMGTFLGLPLARKLYSMLTRNKEVKRND